jgi:hypothetical protein
VKADPGYIFREETLIQPKGTDNLRFYIQFFPHLTDNGILRGFMEFHSSAREIEIRRILIFCSKQFVFVEDYSAYPIIKYASIGFECKIHRTSQTKNKTLHP